MYEVPVEHPPDRRAARLEATAAQDACLLRGHDHIWCLRTFTFGLNSKIIGKSSIRVWAGMEKEDRLLSVLRAGLQTAAPSNDNGSVAGPENEAVVSIVVDGMRLLRAFIELRQPALRAEAIKLVSELKSTGASVHQALVRFPANVKPET